MESNRIHPNYRPMVSNRERNPAAASARSETQQQLTEMRAGEAWSHEATARDYRAGGNEGDFTGTAGELTGVTDNGEMPGGITRQYQVTDRNLAFPGEEGYPTPT